MKKRKRLSAKQRKYFAPKRKTSKRSKKVMAKRKGYRRSFSRGSFGGMKGMIAPVLGGVADSYLDPMLPIDGVGATGIGFFMHNETIKNIGLYKIGFSLGNIIPLPGRTGTAQGGLL